MIRHFSRNVAIRLRNAARPAARQRRTNRAERADFTGGVNHNPRQSHVPDAGSKPLCRLRREATGPFIARTATAPGKAAAAAGESADIAVIRSGFREEWQADPAQPKQPPPMPDSVHWLQSALGPSSNKYSRWRYCSAGGCTLKEIEESDLDFLLVPLPALLAIYSKLSSAVHPSKRNKFNGTR